jgi:hypothetical protein
MTPVSSSLATPLIEGLRNELIVRDESARRIFPHIEPLDYETAVRLALARVENGEIETLWSDALASTQRDEKPVHLALEQGMFIERRAKITSAPSQALFRAFSGLGGNRGWPPLNWLWQLRGALDRLLGGVGLRRGRRHPDELRMGDALDFWRVETVIPGRLLRLRAEMKLPGQGWLQFEVGEQDDGSSELIQTAYFAPKGLVGLLYWHGLYPLHGIIFSSMLDTLVKRAEETLPVPLSA